MSSPKHTLDFSHLDEETETDAPTDSTLDSPQVDLAAIQPHLSTLAPPPTSAPRRNPRERGVVHVSDEFSDEGQPPPDPLPPGSHDRLEHDQHIDHNSNHVAEVNGHVELELSRDTPSSATPINATDNSTTVNEASVQPNAIQICYSKNTGNIGVREVPVATRPDGSAYIATQQIPQDWDQREQRPLRKNRIRWVKIFSIIACVLFFPTGIPSAYFAFRVEKEFEEGILRGNIDRAQKFATRSERLSILSIVMMILTAALVVTLIERPHFQSQHYRGTVAG